MINADLVSAFLQGVRDASHEFPVGVRVGNKGAGERVHSRPIVLAHSAIRRADQFRSIAGPGRNASQHRKAANSYYYSVCSI